MNAAVFIVNKLDNENADYEKVVGEATSRFSHDVLPIQFPVHQGLQFEAVIDVLRMKMLQFGRDGKGKYTEAEIPAEYKSKAEERREQRLAPGGGKHEDRVNKHRRRGG